MPSPAANALAALPASRVAFAHTLSAPYDALHAELARMLPGERLVTDPLRLLAWGTDASFYRLVPRLAVIVDAEAEVVAVLAACAKRNAPVTFRAAGTSLSGQAISDSVLVLLGDAWSRVAVAGDAQTITLGPGVIGAIANRRLAPLGRKIGPDPASIDTAMIGGIAANNASGMCCGTAQNTYRTLRGMRIVLADGSVLDTADPASREAFRARRPDVVAGLAELVARVRSDAALAARIRHKYRMKNTTGYSLNALVDHDDPIDVLAHLMVGSEGTLGLHQRDHARHRARASVQGERPDPLPGPAAAPAKPSPGSPPRPSTPWSSPTARRCARSRASRGCPRSSPRSPPRPRRCWSRRADPTRRPSRSASPRAKQRSTASACWAASASRAMRTNARASGRSARACSRRWARCDARAPRSSSRTSPSRWTGSPTRPSTCAPCCTSTATGRRSSSATRSRATCTSCSRRTSTIPRRSSATRASWTRWRSSSWTATTDRSRPSMAPAATWRPSSRWNGVRRRTR